MATTPTELRLQDIDSLEIDARRALVRDRPAVGRPIRDLAGQRFGRWTVVGLEDLGAGSGGMKVRWVCRCDCGTVRAVIGRNLRRGTSVSCGCFHREISSALCTRLRTRHGHAQRGADSSTYRSWMSMRRRCTAPSAWNFKYYGARGITICERWSVFENFLADMGERPKGKTLDRRDNNGNYEPGNCRWADKIEQRRNRRG